MNEELIQVIFAFGKDNGLFLDFKAWLDQRGLRLYTIPVKEEGIINYGIGIK